MTNNKNNNRVTGTFFRLSIAFILSAFANAKVAVTMVLPKVQGRADGWNALAGALNAEVTKAIESVAKGTPAENIAVTWTTPEATTGVRGRRHRRRLDPDRDDDDRDDKEKHGHNGQKKGHGHGHGRDEPDNPVPANIEFVSCPVCPDGEYCVTYCDEGDSSGIKDTVTGRVAIMKGVRAAISTVCEDRDCNLVKECVACCADYELSVQVSVGLPPPEPTIPPLPDCPDDGKCVNTPNLMHMEYTAGRCDDSENSQVRDFVCTDYSTTGLPTTAYVVVTQSNSDKEYYSGARAVGLSYSLSYADEPGRDFDDELKISIYKDENDFIYREKDTKPLQEVIFRSDCDVMTACQDTFGASRLIGWDRQDGAHVMCNECDPNWCPNNGTLTQEPFGMEMLFTGGKCPDEDDPHLPDQKAFSCTDEYRTGAPTKLGEEAYIIVTKKDKEDIKHQYFTGTVKVGDRFRLAHSDLNRDFDNDLSIKIYEDHHTETEPSKLLQLVHFDSSGSITCFNKFGASQVVEWENHIQGVVQCSDCPH